jgi:hypothetical protein
MTNRRLVLAFVVIFLFGTFHVAGPIVTSSAQLGPVTSSTSAPKLFAMSSSETMAHELSLKAVKSGEQITRVQGFKVDLSNVIQIPLNGKLTVISTDKIQITNVKLTNPQGTTSEIVPGNVISFAGASQGVYTLDIIITQGNRQLAYEGILVIGQSAQSPNTVTVVNQVINKEITKSKTETIFKESKQPPPVPKPNPFVPEPIIPTPDPNADNL